MVYYFDMIDQLDEEFIEKAICLLPTERITRVLNLRNMKDRYQTILVYILLLYGLKIEDIKPHSMNLKYGEYGKPYFESEQRVFFNFSHCSVGAACVISTEDVGIDIQEIVPLNKLVLKKVCSTDEIMNITVSQEPNTEFTRLWTMKESYLKAIGKGISEELEKINFVNIRNHRSYRNNYCLTSYMHRNYVVTVSGLENDSCPFINVSLENILDFIS